MKVILSTLFLAILLPSTALAEEVAPTFDSGDTAWMLVSALLVLMMTLPGLALFYGGLVKKDNVLSTLMQSLAVCAVISVFWPIIGYTLAFTENNMFVGGMDKFMLAGVGVDSAEGTIPETVFIMFQMTFAIITTALLIGAVADRIKFKALLVFAPLWMIIVYAPIAHWVWGPGGFIGGIGLDDYEGFLGFGEALDFAGGTVVHINSGIAGLVAAFVLGKSLRDRPPSTDNNLVMSVIGTGLLWVGWFGFNAGSSLAAGGSAGYAMLVTNAAAGMAGLTWIVVELLHKRKASVVGALSGVVAGLVAITPAAGFVDFQGSLFIGFASGIACYLAITLMKSGLKDYDALDVFGLHGIGGIVGALLTGVFASSAIGGVGGLLEGNAEQLMAQLVSIIVVCVYSAIMTFALLILVRFMMGGLRVKATTETNGLDLAMHGEKVS
ncbi:MAG: ammonium transporter [Pseudomonadota bacterium]